MQVISLETSPGLGMRETGGELKKGDGSGGGGRGGIGAEDDPKTWTVYLEFTDGETRQKGNAWKRKRE